MLLDWQLAKARKSAAPLASIIAPNRSARSDLLRAPSLIDEPLIFVEVALTREIPASIQALLAEERTILPAKEATTAVFYSISNCQQGLRGVSFGNFLIKQRGFEVTAVASVRTAVTAVAERPFAFAVVEMRLGDGNGLALVEQGI